MRVRDLFEGISPVVYHATSFNSAGKMLDANMMRSKVGEISFTRSLTGSYHKINRLIGIIFELDGRKLNTKYKGAPVGTELWGPDDSFDDEPMMYGKDNGQLEDRLYTHEIKNLTNYINSAIVYVPEEYLDKDTDEFEDESYSQQLKQAHRVIKLLDEHKIPHRYVTSEKELVNPKANNKELFNAIVSRQTNNSDKILEKYIVDFYIHMGGEDDNEPDLD